MSSVRRLPPCSVIDTVPLADCVHRQPRKPWPADLARWAATRALPDALAKIGLGPALSAAVQPTWDRFLTRVETGLRIERHGDDRVVVHCDTFRYRISPEGGISASYPTLGGAYVDSSVEVGRPLRHWVWVQTITNLEIDFEDASDPLVQSLLVRRLAGMAPDVPPYELEALARKWLIAAIIALAQRRFDLFAMRQRLRKALAPDPALLEIARRAKPRSHPDIDLDSVMWNRCIQHRAQLTELHQLAPGLVRYFGVIIRTSRIDPTQPVMRILRNALGGKSLSPQDWKFLLREPLRPIWHMYLAGEIKSLKALTGFLRDWARLHRGVSNARRLPLELWAPLTRTWIEPNGKAVDPPVVWPLTPQATQQAIERYHDFRQRGLGGQFVETEWGPVVRWAANYCRRNEPTTVRAWMTARRMADQEERLMRAEVEMLEWAAVLPRHTNGRYEAVALTRAMDLVEEAIAMRHCADQFAKECAKGRVAVYSLRDAENHQRIATFCARLKPGCTEFYDIKRSLNRLPSEEEVSFAHLTIDALNDRLQAEGLVAASRGETSES